MPRKTFSLDDETVRRIEEMAGVRGSGIGKMSELIRSIVEKAYIDFKAPGDMQFIKARKRTREIEAHELPDGDWLVRVDGRQSIIPGYVFEKTYEVVDS